MDSAHVPKDAKQWHDWLSMEESKTDASYKAKPSILIQDYRSEIAVSRDYQGREILELLQNAADQAKDAGERGRVVIDLQQDGLVVANSGTPFSVGGVQSLQNIHLSPKRHRKRKFIGNKGLGFRAVLNWTGHPIIRSGALALIYSKKVSEAKLKSLMDKNTEIANLVREEQTTGRSLILPVLPFPGYSPSGNISELIVGTRAKQLEKRCRRWQDEGYSTTIGIPFDTPTTYAEALEQIKFLRPETLLFVNYLDEVRFIIPEESERMWSTLGDDKATQVLENNRSLGVWEIHRSDGEIPGEKPDKEQTKKVDYELIVAVPKDRSLSEQKPSPLFSYFPTEITLPLPIVCHATLELDQSRNHVHHSKSNRFVFDCIAEFLAEISENHAAQFPTGANAGFRIVMPIESFSIDLEKEELSTSLKEASRSRAIVPTLEGIPMVPSAVHIINGASDAWLPAFYFHDVAPGDREELQFFKELGATDMDRRIMGERLKSVKLDSIERRVALITGLLKHRIPEEAHTSSLLLGFNGQLVPHGATVFISPKGSRVPKLPDWLTLWFLDESIRAQLADELDTGEARELQSKLSSFGLREYSFGRLISQLVAGFNRRKTKTPEQAEKLNTELLNIVHALYQAEGHSEQRPSFPETTHVLLPSQNGKLVKAHELYMGQDYGAYGNIVQALYQDCMPEKLLAAPEVLSISGNKDSIEEFLRWLGVEKWPRETIARDGETGYLNLVQNSITYPEKFGDDYVFNSATELSNAFLQIEEYTTLDGLEDILSTADSTAIAAWLALDVRTHSWSKRSKSHARFGVKKAYDRVTRHYTGPLPSYIRWKLESTPWLRDKEGATLRPKDCVFGERAIEVLFPKPAKPSDLDLERYGITERELREGWRNGGVLLSLAELELDDIYARLYDLPKQDPKAQSAPRLYRWLLDEANSIIGDGGAARDRFIRSGKMWGIKGKEQDYFPVSELHYVDSEGLPKALLQRLAIADLPHRAGGPKVERTFGVSQIDRVAIKQRIKNYRLAVDLDSEFQAAKPYLYQIRVSQSSHTQHLKTLKELRLKICSEVSADIEYAGEDFSHNLPVWGWLIDNHTLYIRSDPCEIVDISSDLLADTIGVAIASLFRIGDGGEFARMFLCKPGNRKTLLRRMRGEGAEEDIEKLAKEFDQKLAEGFLGNLPEIDVIEEPEPSSVSNAPEDEEVDVTDNGKQPEKPLPETQSSKPLSIAPVDVSPQTGPTRQKLRVQKKTGQRRNRTTTNQIADGDFAERKIIEIEKNFQPPRYPLRVGQITGYDSFGCDILSFDNKELRDKFKSGEDRSIVNVTRFIEVKGRSRQGSEIELRGNGKEAAIKYGDKYYLYRLYQSDEDEYTLSILKNPIAAEEALEAAVYVHIDKAKKTEVFEVKGGEVTN